jgi:chromosome partitioning protein
VDYAVNACPSDNNLAGAEVELAINPIGNNVRLKKAINQIAHRYDYIIIDCPPSLGLLSINVLI